MLKKFTKRLKDALKGDAIYLIAEADSQIAGHCFVTRVVPGSELSHVGEVSMLVDSKYRSRGIGGKLLDSAIKQSKGKFEILYTYGVGLKQDRQKSLQKQGLQTLWHWTSSREKGHKIY